MNTFSEAKLLQAADKLYRQKDCSRPGLGTWDGQPGSRFVSHYLTPYETITEGGAANCEIGLPVGPDGCGTGFHPVTPVALRDSNHPA